MPSIDVQQAPIEDGNVEEAPPVVKSSVGIIYPPPEVRNIVDKTASFVARNGPEFENRIRQNEVNNPKFNFLQPTDAYHAYYQYKVNEFKEGKAQEPQAPKPSQYLGVLRPQEAPKIVEIFVPKDPPPEYEFMCDPPSISAFDLDVVKLTAQFVARNGRQFLTTVMQKEQKNFLFDFLRPQHSLFTYFTKLVEQYTKILIPPKNLKEKLTKEVNHPKEILDQVKYRVEWAKHQEKEKKKEEEALEKERVAYAQIDWHDFVVVETVDFQPTEIGNLPPPTTPEEVGARILQMERFASGGPPMDDAVEMEVESEGEESEEESEEEEEEQETVKTSKAPEEIPRPQAVEESSESSEEEDEEEEEEDIDERIAPLPPPPPPPPAEAPPPPLPPTPEQVIIKKDYDPKVKPAPPTGPSADQYMISPITGEKIPAHKVQEHMRIGLLDSKWMEVRQRTIADKTDQEEVFAPGSAIDSNLKQLAERRTDIFGIGTEETQIGKKIGEEEKKETKVVWDGHTASIEKISQLSRENISIEEQIATIHRAKGLVHDEEKEKIGPAVPKPAPPLPPPPPAVTSTSLPPPPPPQPTPTLAAPPPPPMQPPQQLRPPTMIPQMPRPPMMGGPIGMAGMMMLPPRPPIMMGMPRPPMMAPMMGLQPAPPIISQQIPLRPAVSTPDEPPNKKQKTEENLIPEDVFLQKFKGSVKVLVVVPNVSDKPEWNLKGQTVEFNLPLTDSISVLKAKIHESLAMPAGKQKLQYEGMFVKDSNSLAFYNFMNGATVHLQMKERGGRKK